MSSVGSFRFRLRSARALAPSVCSASCAARFFGVGASSTSASEFSLASSSDPSEAPSLSASSSSPSSDSLSSSSSLDSGAGSAFCFLALELAFAGFAGPTYWALEKRKY